MSKGDKQNDKLDELDKLGEESDLNSFLNDDENGTASGSGSIDFLKNLPVKLTVVVDTVGLTVSDLLNAQPGEVLELDKQVGEPMDVLANGEYFGKAEVVVVNNKYGIRMLEVSGQKAKDKDSEEEA